MFEHIGAQELLARIEKLFCIDSSFEEAGQTEW